MTNHAFIVGTGRCGSTLLSELIRDHSRGLSLSEFFTVLGGAGAFPDGELDGPAMWSLLSTVRDDVLDLLAAAPDLPELLWRGDGRADAAPLELVPLPHLGAGRDVHDELGAFVQRLPARPTAEQYGAVFTWLQLRMGKRYWVERSGGSLEYVGQIVDKWPRAKLVHLFRDGRACAASMARHPFFRLRVARILARDATLPVATALSRPIPPERFGTYWSAVVTSGARVLSRLPRSQVLHVSYDELTLEPARELGRVLAFLGDDGLESFESAGLPSRVRVRPMSPSLAAADEDAALERACRPGMRAVAKLLKEHG